MRLKAELRKELLQKRRSIIGKEQADSLICKNLLESELYKNADKVLFYAALKDEINIDYCISDALSRGKCTGLPVCCDTDGNMKFYSINSLNDLRCGFFGIREPNTERCAEIVDFKNALCIVPAVAYDKNGYRLGYGKGYYDRFLQKVNVISVGLCYNELIIDELPAEKHDISVNYIITRQGIFLCS